MKTKKIFALLLGVIALMSCGGPEEPCEESKLTQEALELATYLTDNYHVGDSVFFTTEKNEIEGFVVNQNRFSPKDELIDMEAGGEFHTELRGYAMSIVLQSKENTFWVYLELQAERQKTHVEGIITVNGKLDALISSVTVNDDVIIIIRGNKKCVLTKNVGITTVSVDKHIWELASK